MLRILRIPLFTLCLIIAVTPFLFGQYIGGSADGYTMGAQLTPNLDCTLPSLFNVAVGGSADGYTMGAVLTPALNCPSQAPMNVGIGGSTDGYSMGAVLTPALNCNQPTSFNVSIGGSADGYASGTYSIDCSTPPTFNVAVGGSMDGYTMGTYINTNVNCTLPQVFNVAVGGSMDGYAAMGTFIITCPPANMFNVAVGGSMEGHPMNSYTDSSIYCNLPQFFNVSIGGGADGYTTMGVFNITCPPENMYNVAIGGSMGGNTAGTYTDSSIHCNLPQFFNVSIGGSMDGHSTALSGCISLCTVTANAGRDTAICKGTSVSLLATGGTSYLWTPTTGLSAANIANPTATPDSTTSYVVTVQDSLGCTAKDTVVVRVNPLPIANAGKDTTICNGTTANLLATGGTSYSWTPSTGLSATDIFNPVATPTSTTNYIVAVHDSLGCMAKDTVVITVDSVAFSVNAGRDTSICLGSGVVLSSTITGCLSTYSYHWFPSTSLNSASLANPIASPDSTTWYVVQVTNETGTMITDSVQVIVHSLPILTVHTYPTICQGQSAQLDITGDNGTFNWVPSAGLSDTTIANPIASPSTTTTYVITLVDANNGCQVQKDATVFVNSIPSIQLNNDSTICKGETIQLNAIAVADSFQWSPQEGLDNPITSFPNATPNATSVYTVTATNKTCSSQKSITINVINTLDALFTYSFPGLAVQFSTTIDSTANYAWTFGDGETSNAVSPSHTYLQSGVYQVCLDAANRCGQKKYCNHITVRDIEPPCPSQ